MGRPYNIETLEEKIRRQTKIDKNGCWIWQGGSAANGYGMCYVQRIRANRGAHRVAWEVFNGQIPEGMNVCHRCDTPKCCNPDHLFLGSALDNVRDKIEKGRHRHGSAHHFAKLDEPQVREIFLAKGPRREIAKRFNVTRQTVGHIKRRATWAHATADL